MNNPKAMQNPDLNSVLITAYCFINKVVEKEMGEEKSLEDGGEYGQTETVDKSLPVIDGTAKTVQITLEDDGTISRKDEKGITTKSKESPETIKTAKRIQDVANQEKLQANRKAKKRKSENEEQR